MLSRKTVWYFIHYSISGWNGSVIVFIIRADNLHAVYNPVTTKELVHMRKYI